MASLASSEGFRSSIQAMEDIESIVIPEMDSDLLTELLEGSEQLSLRIDSSQDEACQDCIIDDIISDIEGSSRGHYSIESPSSSTYDPLGWMEIDDHDMSYGWYMIDACMDEDAMVMHGSGDECMLGFLYDGECLDQAIWD